MSILKHLRRPREFVTSLKVGIFLARREIKRANLWTTGLIILVMMLTFLNLIVVSGILVGLIEGSTSAVRERYTGDLILSPLKQKTYIENSVSIENIIRHLPGVAAVTTRYVESGRLEANYKDRTRLTDLVDSAAGLVTGIDPVVEDRVTGLARFIKEGQYLTPDDYGKILLGANLLYKYTPIDTPGLQTLKNVEAGSKIRLILNGQTQEVMVKGILKTKVGELDQRIYMVASEMRGLIGRSDYNVDEMVIKLAPGVSPDTVKRAILGYGIDEVAKVQTGDEAQPKFLKDIKDTFALLGNMIGSIGLVVASITIFIVIFVNAITRRRYIGIMKGVGITGTAIEISYMIQSMFYALGGMILGAAVVFGFLKPYIAAHPINFPFSDGILVATVSGTLIRAVILFLATMVAGYIPAKIVVKQNTLDAILGR